MINCGDLALTEELIRLFIANSGKPSYAYGLAGANPTDSWLDSHGRPSNKVGIPFGLNNGKLVNVWVGNEELATYELKLYYHYGAEIGLTLLKTFSIPNSTRTKTFTLADIGDISVPKDCQIAARIGTVTGTPVPRNTGAYAIILGSE